MHNILIILIMLVFSAFFSGMEIAYISANRLRMEIDKKQELFASRIISIFTGNPGKYLTTMLVGNNIALVVYGIIMANLLEPFIISYISSDPVILLIQTLISTLLILITAEFLPKVVFRAVANQTLNIFSVPVLFFYTIFYPITSLITWVSESIIKAMHKTGSISSNSKQVFNKIDLAHLINQAHSQETEETEDDNDLKLFQNALDFSSVKIRDCMVPRTEIVAMDVQSTIGDLRKTIIETGYSKIVIYKDSIDDIFGYITAKTLFKNINSINDNIIETSFVPETMSANRLLEKLIQDKKSLAIVVDEFGGISGILTIEDILEEIFGEIEDEHDTVELIEKQINNEEFIFSGRMEIDYINDKYKINIPESEDYETLAGFIFFHYENIPELNERIVIEPFEIKILNASKTKIDLVHLKVIES
ncbi:MAG: HlyC/CorC family transporter [Bacteroidales bacterium]|nr:HlyC/CorC family transporter [Bacteroidales bacterium]